MKYRCGFVSNSSSSSFIVKNYSVLSVQKEMFEIFMKYTDLPKDEAWKFFNNWYKFLSFGPMSRKEKKDFEKLWHEYTWCDLEDNDLPTDCRGTVVIELEGAPYNLKAYYFKTECFNHFKNSIDWRRLS